MNEIVNTFEGIANTGIYLFRLYKEIKESDISDEQLLYQVYLESKLNKNLINSIKLSKNVEFDDVIIIDLSRRLSIQYIELLLLHNKKILKSFPNRKDSKENENILGQLLKKLKFDRINDNLTEILIFGNNEFTFIEACEFAYIKLNEILILSQLEVEGKARKKTNYKIRLKNLREAFHAIEFGYLELENEVKK